MVWLVVEYTWYSSYGISILGTVTSKPPVPGRISTGGRGGLIRLWSGGELIEIPRLCEELIEIPRLCEVLIGTMMQWGADGTKTL